MKSSTYAGGDYSIEHLRLYPSALRSVPRGKFTFIRRRKTTPSKKAFTYYGVAARHCPGAYSVKAKLIMGYVGIVVDGNVDGRIPLHKLLGLLDDK